MGRLEGKTAIVTGATGGIGKATVELFLKEGARVAAVDIAEDKLEELEEEINDDSNLITITADVSDEEDVENYVNKTKEKFGQIDVLFNNAGILGEVESFEKQSIETFDQLYSVNVRGVVLGMLKALPIMIEQKSGSIINTSSISGLSATPGFGPYETSKYAVNGATNAAATSVADKGVRVNTINPSQVDTDMVDDVEAGIGGEDDSDVQSELEGAIPMQRYAKPDEVANLVLFLASDDSKFITGSQYRVDGGLLA